MSPSQPLLWYRWTTFALFIICNAIICSAAAWNLSIAQAVGREFQVDSYLIFVGAFSLLFIFPIIFVDIAQKNALTSHVWFEVSWALLFWVIELAGAVALAAKQDKSLCGLEVVGIFQDPCSSTKVLLVFSWMCTIILFAYLLVLIVSSIMHQKEDKQVWHSGVRDFPWFATRQGLRSLPSTPIVGRFHRKAPSLVAPKPRRVAPPPIFVQREGLNSKYEIEHYRGPSRAPSRSHTLSRGPSRSGNRSASPVLAPPMPDIPTVQEIHRSPSIYPQHIQSNLPPTTPIRQSAPSPPPLGDWPLAPSSVHSHRQYTTPQPSSPAGFGKDSSPGIPPIAGAARSRPSGPRTRTSSAGAHPRPPLTGDFVITEPRQSDHR